MFVSDLAAVHHLLQPVVINQRYISPFGFACYLRLMIATTGDVAMAP